VAQDASNHRTDARIALQLEMRVPMRAIFRVRLQPFFEQAISIHVHGAEFPHRQRPATESLADLAVKDRATAGEFDRR